MITGVYAIKFESQISLGCFLPYFPKELYLIDSSRNVERAYKSLLNKVNKSGDIRNALERKKAEICTGKFELLEELDFNSLDIENWKEDRKFLLEELKEKHREALEKNGYIVIDVKDLK